MSCASAFLESTLYFQAYLSISYAAEDCRGMRRCVLTVLSCYAVLVVGVEPKDCQLQVGIPSIHIN